MLTKNSIRPLLNANSHISSQVPLARYAAVAELWTIHVYLVRLLELLPAHQQDVKVLLLHPHAIHTVLPIQKLHNLSARIVREQRATINANFLLASEELWINIYPGISSNIYKKLPPY